MVVADKLRRKKILIEHDRYKKLMTIYAIELCSKEEKQKFYREKIYPHEWYYIDNNWYYHKLEIACKNSAEGQQSYIILDIICDPMYGYREESASVFFGLNQNLSLERCQAQLNACYGKVVRKEG